MQTYPNKNKIEERIERLKSIQSELLPVKNLEKKLEIIDKTPEVTEFLSSNPATCHFFETLNVHSNMILKSMILIGQQKIVSVLLHHIPVSDELMDVLHQIDSFYETVHGLIAYQIMVLQLIFDQKNIPCNFEDEKKMGINFLKPSGVDISKDSRSLRIAIRQAIENLDKMGEIYPVGGAGERLKLVDEETNEPLPVAKLAFLGSNLLEGLVRDLEAREFLTYQLTGKQIITPIAMMTSDEKHNDEHIKQLCISSNWFHRGKENFSIFSQPMVPVVTVNGDWLLSSLNSLMVKPGGHGVIWKLAEDAGVFDWFRQMNISKMMARQINNPIAGVDGGLLKFAGVGFRDNKVFGFSSCDRVINSSEGMDILIEKETPQGFLYKITNIEYTEFVKNSIVDEPECETSQFSKFPTNTNILFLDILEVEKAIKKCPVPGMLINMKSTVPYIDKEGCLTKIQAGRLESTMQNIADDIVDVFPHQLSEDQYGQLKSYLTYNLRNKTISVTKRSLNSNDSFSETPESCFYEMINNGHDLFSNYCGIKLPKLRDPETYLKQGPSIMLNYHPALGPLYSVIAQKIRGGIFFEDAELQLEIAEVDLENIELDGSLLIYADQVTGEVNDNGVLQYGKNLGKCTLKNVKIKNSGIDRFADNCYWKNEIKRFENLRITLHGNAELIAENVTFNGNFNLEVPNGHRLTATMLGDKLQFNMEKIETTSIYWIYEFDEEDRIVLKKNSKQI